MADINELIARSAPKVDFSAIGELPQAYYQGLEQRQKQDVHDVFKQGVPRNPDGSLDYPEMVRKLYQVGEIDKGTALSNLDIQRQQLKNGAEVAPSLAGVAGGQSPPLVSPSTSRVLPTPQGGVTTGQPGPRTSAVPTAPSGQYKGGDNGNSITGLVMSRVPAELSGPLIAQIAAGAGVDPNQPLSDPAVRAKVLPVAQKIIGQYTSGQGEPQQAPSPQAPQAPPQTAQPQMAPQPAPQAAPGLASGITDPQTLERMNRAALVMANPGAYPPGTVAAAKAIYENLSKQTDLTPGQKEYVTAVRQGFGGTMQQYEEQKKLEGERAGETGKNYAKKYEAIVDQGNKAFVEIPQLEAVQKLMDDPNFYSGVGEKYNLWFKRALTTLGGDPNTAVPQEAFRKVISGSILNSLSMLKGLGQIRVAEINLARTAAASPENTPAANRMLVEISKRVYQRAQDVAELAQKYNGGKLDAGFDQKVTQYYQTHPLFSEAEIKNPTLLAGKQSQAESARPASRADYDKLPSGTKYIAPDGSERTKR